jgi:branched-chain amino acid transport system permease protein
MSSRQGWTVSSGFVMDILLQQIINGLTTGSVYAVVALGYTMVYGVIQLINFAHGEVVMIGAMVAFSVIASLAGSTLPPLAIVLAGVLAAIPACMAIGYSLERVAYRPLRHAPRLAPLITAIGMSIILQHLALLIWGRNPLAFPQIIDNPSFAIGGAAISGVQIAIILLSMVMMAGLSWFVYRTRFGIAIRATAENVHVAALMGINADRVIAATFVIGAGLGAVAGVMFGTYYGIAHYTMGFTLGLKASPPPYWAASATCPAPWSAACCWGWSKRWAPVTSANSPTSAAGPERVPARDGWANVAPMAGTSCCSAATTRTYSPS